jgi:hypothetical protein
MTHPEQIEALSTLLEDGELTYDYTDFAGQPWQLRADISPDGKEHYLETYKVRRDHSLQEYHRSHPTGQSPEELAYMFVTMRRRLAGANP